MISPALGRRTIAVEGSTAGSVAWGQSAYGSTVDWTAPAAYIHRAEMRSPSTPSNAERGDGTSFAAAITSGTAALWLARHEGALTAAYPQAWHRVEAFKAVVKGSARQMPNQQPGSFGAGILDVAAVLNVPLPTAASLLQEAPA